MDTFVVHTDGGARGNPGPAGSGAVVERQTSHGLELVAEVAEYLGETTNNVAEYTAVIRALERVLEHAGELPVTVEVFLDSELIAEQMAGRYKVKNEGLKPLYARVRELIVELGGVVQFQHVPREQNTEADRLVNHAIDAALTGRHE